MADRLKQLYQHLSSVATPPHPFDPLSTIEIEYSIAIVRRDYGHLGYNAVTLSEPKKKEMLVWLADPSSRRPRRMAEVVAVDKNSFVYDGVVDLQDGKIVGWEKLEGVQPLITMEDLQGTEEVVRTDPKVIEQCKILGIYDMRKVYCDRKLDFPPRSQVLIIFQRGPLATMSVSEIRCACNRLSCTTGRT